MANVQHNRPISTWQAGDSVQGFALLSKKERRQDRNGNDYLDIELADSSGSIVGKVWANSPALAGEYAAHDFIAFRGSVRNYRDQLQINLDHCRQAKEEDRQYGFDESLLIPSTKEDIDQLYGRLEKALDSITSAPLKALAERGLERFGDALREHPAAKTMHHAYRGGLLEHTVSMMELALAVCQHFPQLNRELVLIGAFFHDLGKIHEIGAMPANDYTPVGRLVGHVVLGRDMIRECCGEVKDFPPELQLHLEHLVLSHQGRYEYGAPVEPMTAEAIALHFIDDLDSKLNQLTNARQASPEPFQYLRGMSRYMLVHELDASGQAVVDPAVHPAVQDDSGDS
ncbi:MAG: HD domain-containing protein [Acidobacteriota bacterium]